LRRLFLVLAALLAAGLAAWLLVAPMEPPGEVSVMVRPGWTVRRMAQELEAQGVIRSRYAFLAWHTLGGRPLLQAGEYRFSGPRNVRAVHDKMARGEIHFYSVTFPEGFNLFDVAQALSAAGLGSREEFLELARTQTSLIEDLDPAARSLEGYLFPDTYRFTRTQTPQEMLAVMVRRFRREAADLGLTADFRRTVTMASIVEKETRIPEERPIVAGVFYNRLARNIALAADPTVVYAALLEDRYRGAIYRSDLQSDSPYNTYRRTGLPPGPIANPGREALRAALEPAATDYLYFVSDAQGRHRFARTYAEHNRNVQAYRKALAEAAASPSRDTAN
jgi:UPF0755 protein